MRTLSELLTHIMKNKVPVRIRMADTVFDCYGPCVEKNQKSYTEILEVKDDHIVFRDNSRAVYEGFLRIMPISKILEVVVHKEIWRTI